MKVEKYTKPKSLDELSEEVRQEIRTLFHLGHGPNFIGLKLKISHSLVSRYLLSEGLKRTKEESIAIKRKKN